MNNADYVFQKIKDNVYKRSVGKHRIEKNGSLVFMSSCVCSDIYFMNQRASKIFIGLDGNKTLNDILLMLKEEQVDLGPSEIIRDIMNTLRFLESVRAVQLTKKGGVNDTKNRRKQVDSRNAEEWRQD